MLTHADGYIYIKPTMPTFFTKKYNNMVFNREFMASFKKFANVSELPTQGKADVRITEISCISVI